MFSCPSNANKKKAVKKITHTVPAGLSQCIIMIFGYPEDVFITGKKANA